jgi:hypothetical protein
MPNHWIDTLRPAPNVPNSCAISGSSLEAREDLRDQGQVIKTPKGTGVVGLQLSSGKTWVGNSGLFPLLHVW